MRGSRCATTLSQLPATSPSRAASTTFNAGSSGKTCHMAPGGTRKGRTRRGSAGHPARTGPEGPPGPGGSAMPQAALLRRAPICTNAALAHAKPRQCIGSSHKCVESQLQNNQPDTLPCLPHSIRPRFVSIPVLRPESYWQAPWPWPAARNSAAPAITTRPAPAPSPTPNTRARRPATVRWCTRRRNCRSSSSPTSPRASRTPRPRPASNPPRTARPCPKARQPRSRSPRRPAPARKPSSRRRKPTRALSRALPPAWLAKPSASR
ncbi:Uncharacterised protein [Bordetella pertussis]|nr:Uncharacterised protein [Bordetella pertussis]